MFSQQLPRHEILFSDAATALPPRPAPHVTVRPHVASSAVPGGVSRGTGGPTAAVLSPLDLPS